MTGPDNNNYPKDYMAHNPELGSFAVNDSNPAHPDAPASNSGLDRRCDANRRNKNLQAFVYGNFRPRRRSSRRASDQFLPWIDWHEPRVLYFALGILLLSYTDALFTLNLLNHGASEANAFMASMLELGINHFVISKICLTSFSIIALVALARHKIFGPISGEQLLQFFLVGYCLLIGYEIYLFLYIFGFRF